MFDQSLMNILNVEDSKTRRPSIFHKCWCIDRWIFFWANLQHYASQRVTSNLVCCLCYNIKTNIEIPKNNWERKKGTTFKILEASLNPYISKVSNQFDFKEFWLVSQLTKTNYTRMNEKNATVFSLKICSHSCRNTWRKAYKRKWVLERVS